MLFFDFYPFWIPNWQNDAIGSLMVYLSLCRGTMMAKPRGKMHLMWVSQHWAFITLGEWDFNEKPTRNNLLRMSWHWGFCVVTPISKSRLLAFKVTIPLLIVEVKESGPMPRMSWLQLVNVVTLRTLNANIVPLSRMFRHESLMGWKILQG